MAPLNPTYTDREIEPLVRDVDPRLIVCDPEFAERARRLAQLVGGAKVIVVGADEITLDRLLSEPAAPLPLPEPDDLCALFFTGGTTGLPKGAEHRHRNLMAFCYGVAALWPLPLDEVSAIVSQIADAVHAAHLVGIVHRDLKPDNVMYDPATRQVKLLDFGIATDTDIAPEQRLTRAGFFVGTLMYVAPEALSGELVGPLADQYSLATIAYFLLTGCLPFPAKTPREMFSQLLSQPPIPLNQAKAGLRFSPAVEGVIMRALSKEPAKRYPDVIAFAADFSDAIQRPADDDKPGLGAKIASLFGRTKK